MNKPSFTLTGNLVDPWKRSIYPAELTIEDGKIKTVRPLTAGSHVPAHFILPGFVDSHVHIESSMLIPSEFARLAVVHGTVGTVSDPHEIANVCGMEGVEFMNRTENRFRSNSILARQVVCRLLFLKQPAQR